MDENETVFHSAAVAVERCLTSVYARQCLLATLRAWARRTDEQTTTTQADGDAKTTTTDAFAKLSTRDLVSQLSPALSQTTTQTSTLLGSLIRWLTAAQVPSELADLRLSLLRLLHDETTQTTTAAQASGFAPFASLRGTLSLQLVNELLLQLTSAHVKAIKHKQTHPEESDSKKKAKENEKKQDVARVRKDSQLAHDMCPNTEIVVWLMQLFLDVIAGKGDLQAQAEAKQRAPVCLFVHFVCPYMLCGARTYCVWCRARRPFSCCCPLVWSIKYSRC